MSTNQTPAQYAAMIARQETMFYNAEERHLNRKTQGLNDTTIPTIAAKAAQLRREYRQYYPTASHQALDGTFYGLTGTCPPLTVNHLLALPPTRRRRSRYGNLPLPLIPVAGPSANAVANTAIAGPFSAIGSASGVSPAGNPVTGPSSASVLASTAIAGPSSATGPASATSPSSAAALPPPQPLAAPASGTHVPHSSSGEPEGPEGIAQR